MNDHSLGLMLSCTVLMNCQEFSDPVQNILNKVSKHFDKHPSYLFVKDRKPKRVYMRQICMVMLSGEGFTQNEIAGILETSQEAVCHHLKTIGGLLDVDVDVRADLVKIRA